MCKFLCECSQFSWAHEWKFWATYFNMPMLAQLVVCYRSLNICLLSFHSLSKPDNLFYHLKVCQIFHLLKSTVIAFFISVILFFNFRISFWLFIICLIPGILDLVRHCSQLDLVSFGSLNICKLTSLSKSKHWASSKFLLIENLP